jgi:hypothetical protein
MERDENYVPRTRSDYHLPAEKIALPVDYHEIFEETPIYTLSRMIFMQALGWQCYLLTNVMGNPAYPSGTNVSHLFCSAAVLTLISSFRLSISAHRRVCSSPMSGMALLPPTLA